MVKGTSNQPTTNHQPCSWRIPKIHDFPQFADGIWGEVLDTWIGSSCLRWFSPFKTPCFPPDLGWPRKNIRQKMFGNSDHSWEVSASRCASNEHTFQIRSQATRLNSITKLKLFLSWCYVFVRIRSRLFEIYKKKRWTGSPFQHIDLDSLKAAFSAPLNGQTFHVESAYLLSDEKQVAGGIATGNVSGPSWETCSLWIRRTWYIIKCMSCVCLSYVILYHITSYHFIPPGLARCGDAKTKKNTTVLCFSLCSLNSSASLDQIRSQDPKRTDGETKPHQVGPFLAVPSWMVILHAIHRY